MVVARVSHARQPGRGQRQHIDVRREEAQRRAQEFYRRAEDDPLRGARGAQVRLHKHRDAQRAVRGHRAKGVWEGAGCGSF